MCHVKTTWFVLSCHFVGTSLPEIALSAWMSVSSFAGSPRCAFTLTRNVAAPAVVLFRSSSIASNKMSAYWRRFPAFTYPSFHSFQQGLVVAQIKHGACHRGRVMPRQRRLFPDGASWIIPLRVTPSSAAFSFVFTGSHTLLPNFFIPASAAKLWKRDIRSASEKAFPAFFMSLFWLLNSLQKRCFSTQEFTRFLSTVSSQRWATRSDVSFQTK